MIDEDSIYSLMVTIKDKFPLEVNIIALLSQCPGGLSTDDISYIVQLDEKLYGNWENLIKEMSNKKKMDDHVQSLLENGDHGHASGGGG